MISLAFVPLYGGSQSWLNFLNRVLIVIREALMASGIVRLEKLMRLPSGSGSKFAVMLISIGCFNKTSFGWKTILAPR
jgi:hypothetical protein